MEFEWDENKRAEVLKKHGVDILDAALIFENPVLTRLDTRRDYGEPRYISMGEVDGTVYIVVHTQRGDYTRLITAWKGGSDDRKIYEASVTR
ncbi:MAG: BrnT family toxin [Pseudomonadota bacterium]